MKECHELTETCYLYRKYRGCMRLYCNEIDIQNILDEHIYDGCRVLFGKDISEDNIRSALQLDYMCYDDIYHLDVDRCIEYHNKNPYIYIMVVDDSDKAIGYINFSPVIDDIYEVLRKGKCIDTIITANDICIYKPGEAYSFYLSSICVHPDYRKRGIAKLLLSFLDKLEESLKSSDIIIRRIVADAVSKSGEKILKSRGFYEVCRSEHNSMIMEKIDNG